MGASAEAEYKRQNTSLARLKKIAVVIAILDLILAINDSRNVGRFFLLLTMSSTFDTSPENVIRDHCLQNVEGICETYFTTIAGGTPDSPYRTFDGKPSHYYGTTKAFHRYIFPETFKELVNSWLTMFDQSRADTNVSFYYDGGGGGRPPLSSSPVDLNLQETYLPDDKKYNVRDNNQRQSDIHSSASSHQGESGDSSTASPSLPKMALTDPFSPTSTNTGQVSPHPPGRKKRGVSSPNRERNNSADTAEEMLEEHAKNANSRPVQKTGTSAPPQILQDFKGMTTPASTAEEHILQDDLASTTTAGPWTKAGPGAREKLKQRAKAMIQQIPPPVMERGKRDFSAGNDHRCLPPSTKLPEVDNGIMSKGPKKLITFVQDEVFSRWPCLLQRVGDVLEQRNISSAASPEAGRIKMFIEVRPFGPDSFKDSRKRLKATQQILFDYPWLTMFQIHSRLSGAFTKIFVVITFYTWIWGTLIALMLLIGSLTEDQTTLHGWIIFNILYSLLIFMIDDWIHSNISPQRSSLSVWLFVIYSLYKPVAAWIGFTQWSELKKVSSEATTSSTTSNFKSLKSRKSCESPGERRRLRGSSSSSEGTTKESTVVDIITPTPTPTLPSSGGRSLVSTLELGPSQDPAGPLCEDCDHEDDEIDEDDGDGNCDHDDVDMEEFEDLELDEDLDEEDSESEEDGESKDVGKVGSGGQDDGE